MTKEPLRSIKRIGNPTKWPHFPLCPVKKGNSKLGVIVASEPTTVRYANLFMLPKSLHEFKQLDGVSYNSIEELTDDGWQVD